MVGATIKSTGKRVDNNNKKKVGVFGAYALPLIEWTRELITDSAHAGEILENPTGAAGEDTVRLADDNSFRAMGIMEWDEGQATGVSTDQAAGDDALVLPFNMNKGAVCRNVSCVDPDTKDVEPNHPLSTMSGTQGSLFATVETTLVSSNTGTTEAFNAAVVSADVNQFDFLRTVMKQLYFLADPSAAYLDVAFII